MGISIIIVYASMMLLLVILSTIMKRKIIFVTIGAVLLGVSCNAFVVKTNDGKMPVFIENMSEHTKADLRTAPRHQAGTVNTKHAYLADFIALKKTQSIYSPGDVSMTLGPIVLALSVLLQIVYTLRYEGVMGFIRNNQPISYYTSIMTIYAVYLGCRHILAYA